MNSKARFYTHALRAYYSLWELLTYPIQMVATLDVYMNQLLKKDCYKPYQSGRVRVRHEGIGTTPQIVLVPFL